MQEFAEWDSFYLIVGGAAGALIGLQFVVMSLFAASPGRPAPEAGAAFATPTVMHFAAVFLLAAILRAPWKTATPPAVIWGLMGVIGIVYSVMIVRRMREARSAYIPVFEDWLFHVILPFTAYIILAVSALAVATRTNEALFGVGTSALLLLLIGIHNAWDAASYNVFAHDRPGEGEKDTSSSDDPDENASED